jgi:hypothetical protein
MERWKFPFWTMALYLFRFVDESTRDTVLEEKIWYFANKPIILRRWTPGMQMMNLSLNSVPIWIKLHNLPLEYWNTVCLSHIASGVGKPICADSVTEQYLRLGFARVLVEVNVDDEVRKEIDVLGIDGIKLVWNTPGYQLDARRVGWLVMLLIHVPSLAW